jgi:hypothetical protein
VALGQARLGGAQQMTVAVERDELSGVESDEFAAAGSDDGVVHPAGRRPWDGSYLCPIAQHIERGHVPGVFQTY